MLPQKEGLGEGEAWDFQLCDPGQGVCPLWALTLPTIKQEVHLSFQSSLLSMLIYESVNGARIRGHPGFG